MKIILIGDGEAGKTTFLKKYIFNKFIESSSTIGVDFECKILNIKNRSIKAQIWDKAGYFKILLVSIIEGYKVHLLYMILQIEVHLIVFKNC